METKQREPERKPELWEYDDSRELLRPFETPSEAITDWFDQFWGLDPKIDGKVIQTDRIPRKLKVFGYARMVPDTGDITDLLDIALESLDEEFGDPDDWFEPTDAMKEAELVFKRAILAEYKPFMMEVVQTEEYDIVEWARDEVSPERFAALRWVEDE